MKPRHNSFKNSKDPKKNTVRARVHLPAIQVSKSAQEPLRIQDQFLTSSLAKKMRNEFQTRFENPLHATSERFVWDLWNVKNQYRLLRTPFQGFFSEPTQNAFLKALTEWGRTHLGCQLISEPWISAYVDGCYQNLHSDVPHGPWSFVFSLTVPNKNSPFRGGNTLLAKNDLVSFAQSGALHHSKEMNHFFHSVEPKFNRLVVFDPRYPHGVERVSNSEDLLESRLVIHGWFTDPRVMVEGPLTSRQIENSLQALITPWLNENPNQWSGLLSLRLTILPSGSIQTIETLCAHLINPQGESINFVELKTWVESALLAHPQPFPKAKSKTTLTIPIQF